MLGLFLAALAEFLQGKLAFKICFVSRGHIVLRFADFTNHRDYFVLFACHAVIISEFAGFSSWEPNVRVELTSESYQDPVLPLN